VVPGQLKGLEGENGQLSGVLIDDLAGNARRLEADKLLCFYGLQAHAGPLGGWGLTMEGGKVVIDPADMSTNLPGVFAVGDIATHPGKLKLILAGFSEAALAARSAHAFVYPGRALHEVHSTSMGIPGKSGI
jgi:thioredoxin reductase (NADPH)